jgi:hypothetical protein
MTMSLDFQLPTLDEFNVGTGAPAFVNGVGDKVPDLMLYFKRNKNAKSVPVLVSEVGLSEKYSELESSMNMWLTNLPSVHVGLLVKIEERPQYRSPLGSHSSKYFEFLRNYGAERPAVIAPKNPEKEGSPLYMSSVRLVGQTKAYMEVWARDPDTGKPMLHGDRIVSHSNPGNPERYAYSNGETRNFTDTENPWKISR